MVTGGILSHTMMNHDEPLNPLTSCKWIHLRKKQILLHQLGVLGHPQSRNQITGLNFRWTYIIVSGYTKLRILELFQQCFLWSNMSEWKKCLKLWRPNIAAKITHFRYSNGFSAFVEFVVRLLGRLLWNLCEYSPSNTPSLNVVSFVCCSFI